ncbi:MAG TPA: hypothetical protein VH088_10760 [Terriglobales bacterium]|jgi:hypothetical protein|nr:hypothetical protein [Terriglobales bacterium]
MKPPANVKTPAQYIDSLPADRAKTIATVRIGEQAHSARHEKSRGQTERSPFVDEWKVAVRGNTRYLRCALGFAFTLRSR